MLGRNRAPSNARDWSMLLQHTHIYSMAVLPHAAGAKDH